MEVPRSCLPTKLDTQVAKGNVSNNTFRLQDLVKWEDLKGHKSLSLKPIAVQSPIPWNALLKVIIHSIYSINGHDVRSHPFEV